MTDQPTTIRTDEWPPRWTLLGAGVVGLIVCAFGAVADAAAFWPAFLATYLFWLGVSLGGLGLLLLHHLTGGRWGWTINRELTSVTQTLPLMVLLFLPLLVGLGELYPWAASSPGEVSLSTHQQSYLTRTDWLIRAAGYFGVWIISTIVLSRIRPRRLQSPAEASRPRLAAIGLILFWLTVSFAGFDWMMSLEPSWSSTMYGSLVAIGFAVAGLAGVILLRGLVDRRGGSADKVMEAEWHDLGNLLQAVNLLWVYFAFSQYLIIWSGDLPSEVVWYQRRNSGIALTATVALLTFHFAVPFALLLTTEVKRRRNRIMGVGILLLVMRLVDLDWLIWPAFEDASWRGVLWQVAALVGIGGLWLAAFAWRWSRLAPVPAALRFQELAHAEAETEEAMV